MDHEQEAGQRRRKLLAQAMKLLARREHSRAELAVKLMKRGYEEAETKAVLDECEAQRWLDDDRYAEMYVRQRKEALYGPLRILAELKQRGIHDEPMCLAKVSEAEWRASATQLRAKRFGLTGILEREERGRQGRYLAQRGFMMSQIEYALEQEQG